MGSGASSLSDDEGAKCNRELYAPKPDPNAKGKKSGVCGSRPRAVFTASKVASDDTTITDSYQHRAIDLNAQTNTSDIRLFSMNEEEDPTNTRTSATKLMTRLVYETIPDFLSYTVEDPSGTDLEAANSARLMLVTPANYLEFYTTVYESLYDASTKHTFPIRTITFKNDFLSELMKMIVLEGESLTAYSTQVAKFGVKYAKEGIDIIECKLKASMHATFFCHLLFALLISRCLSPHSSVTFSDGMFGEAIILAMRKIKKGQRLDLWPRAYSRFVRALVPAMIIHTLSTPALQESLTIAAPGSTEQLQQAHALSRARHSHASHKKVAFRSGAGVSGISGTGTSVSASVVSGVSGVADEGTVTGSTSDQ